MKTKKEIKQYFLNEIQLNLFKALDYKDKGGNRAYDNVMDKVKELRKHCENIGINDADVQRAFERGFNSYDKYKADIEHITKKNM